MILILTCLITTTIRSKNSCHLLSSENCNTKLFWKISKHLLNLGQYTNSIPTLTLNHEIAEFDLEKAQMLNSYFSSQTKVDDTNKPLPNVEPAQHVLESITISVQDVLDVLKHLNVNKACGPDLISPRFYEKALKYKRSHMLYCSIDHLPKVIFLLPSWKDANLTAIHKTKKKSHYQVTIDLYLP